MMDAFGARRYPILVEEGGISRGTSEMTGWYEERTE